MGKGRKVAFLVGVGTYGAGLKQLQCPLNGVRALREVLQTPDVGGFDEVVHLEDPDVGTFRARMGEVFSPLRKDDLALFYFTGHGIKDMAGEFYLTTAQTQLFENGRLNPGTAIEASFVKSLIGNCYAQRKVVVLDCCLGAAFAKGFLTMDDGQVDLQADLGGEGWVVLTAATARNYALEQEGEPLSVYTRYLVEGLKTGAAAPEGQTHITVGQIHAYVRGKVKTAAPTMEPAIFNALAGQEISLAKAVINPELIYRQKVQTKIRRGRIAPAGRRFLETWQTRLNLGAERAAAIEAEVLKPFAEKQRHLDLYADTLREEIEEEFPLCPEAIQDLKELQRLWSLPDGEVESVVREVLQAQGLEGAGGWGAMAALPVEPQRPPQVSDTYRQEVISAPASTLALPSGQHCFETVGVDGRGKIIERSKGEVQCFTEDLGNGVTLALVQIPGGEFLMGAPEGEEGARDKEKPQHRVMVGPFYLGQFPVTQAQYEAVIGQNPSRFKGAQCPVERVSWEDAVAFCAALTERTGRTYRLPSEAEWEYACRGGTTTPFYFGETITTELANYDGSMTYGKGPKGTYRKETTTVGSFPPNSLGLYDMHGNVWEWCEDEWHCNYQGAPSDASAWVEADRSKTNRVVRGGSWVSFPRNCRSAYRSYFYADDRFYNIGFRVVCSAPRTS